MEGIFLGSGAAEMGMRTGQVVQDTPCIQDPQVLLSQAQATEMLKNKTWKVLNIFENKACA